MRRFTLLQQPLMTIEQITGIDFNQKLSEKIEEKIKKELSYKEWSFS